MKKKKFAIIHHVDQETIEYMYNMYPSVFILSTGRAGSKFLAALLDQSGNVTAYHEPRPTLQYFSNYAFHCQDEEILSKIINAARMELILEVFIKNKIYVESNQCLAFFAPVIANLFKKSKFVHLVRHPGDFVRSAIRKGWHKNDSIWESGRVKMADKNLWSKMDQIEKLSWVWNITNRFIEEFKSGIEDDRINVCKLENLSENKEKIKELLQFARARDTQWEKIKVLQKEGVNKFRIGPNEPPNMKKTYDFPVYTEWNNGMKKKLKTIVNDLAVLYGYRL
jgi:hypothetical protein